MKATVLYEIYSISWATACRKFKKTFETMDELVKFYNDLRNRKSVGAIYDARVRKVMSDYKFIDAEIAL